MGRPKKVIHYQTVKNIVVKPAKEIRFLRQIKVTSSTMILFVGHKYSMRDLLRDVINNA